MLHQSDYANQSKTAGQATAPNEATASSPKASTTESPSDTEGKYSKKPPKDGTIPASATALDLPIMINKETVKK